VNCKTQGCDREAKVRGWCKTHYVAHWKETNVSIEKRAGNELYNTWCNKKNNRAPEWHTFEAFKNYVGEYRTGSRLVRLDKALPWGPGNIEWRVVEVPRLEGETFKEYSKRAVMNTQLRQKYDIDSKTYYEMHEAQNGACAICKEPERSLMGGKPMRLAVDHDHATGKVRALLCSTCNTSLGGFQDSPKLLQAAIEYLKHHSENTNEISQGEHQHAD